MNNKIILNICLTLTMFSVLIADSSAVTIVSSSMDARPGTNTSRATHYTFPNEILNSPVGWTTGGGNIPFAANAAPDTAFIDGLLTHNGSGGGTPDPLDPTLVNEFGSSWDTSPDGGTFLGMVSSLEH